MEKKILSFEEFASAKPQEIPENNEFWNDFEIEEEDDSMTKQAVPTNDKSEPLC